jgi:multiple RNA-binding domain-containing protein 1
MPLIDPGADEAASHAPGAPVSAPEPAASAPPVSRLCVKNLPKHCDEKRLRQHFAQSGEGDVTDARVMRTKEGKSRLFGFVGFRTPQAAAAAQKHFARSFIDTSRITIEASKPMGDESLARPWSRYSQGSSAWAKKNPEAAKAASAEAKAKEKAAAGAGGDGKKKRSAVTPSHRASP